jgi:hypothetical protein
MAGKIRIIVKSREGSGSTFDRFGIKSKVGLVLFSFKQTYRTVSIKSVSSFSDNKMRNKQNSKYRLNYKSSDVKQCHFMFFSEK